MSDHPILKRKRVQRDLSQVILGRHNDSNHIYWLRSNLGDSRQILSEAIAKLKSLGEVKVSKLYQSPLWVPKISRII